MLMFKTPLVNISKRDSIVYLMVYRLIILLFSLFFKNVSLRALIKMLSAYFTVITEFTLL